MDYTITYRQKDKGWQVIISYKDINGKWKQRSKQGFETKKKAKEFSSKLVEQLTNDLELQKTVPADMIGITFEEFTKKFLKHMQITHQANSCEAYRTVLIKFADLNDKKITDIRKTHIQSCADDIITSGKVSAATLNTYLNRLSCIFDSAINDHSIINSNPVNKIKVKNENTHKEKHALTKNEEQLLLSNLKNENSYMMSLIALKCGLRLGEILGLTWNDINLSKQTISVNKQWKMIKGNEYGFGTVKSKNSIRTIPMPPILTSELQRFKTSNPININGRLFNYKNTHGTGSDLRKRYKKTGVPVSIHELRHTYATNLISNGVDFKTAAKLLGHTVQMTMETYAHVNDDMMNKAINIINSSI